MRGMVLGLCIGIGCGQPPAAVELPAVGSTAASSSVSPPPVASKTRWNLCRPIGAPLRVSGNELGQNPDVAWDGHDLLVAYERTLQSTGLAAVTRDGRILWTERFVGTKPHVAWNERTRAGMLVTSGVIVWLGSDGKPSSTVNIPRVTNVGFEDVPFPTEAGFLVVTGESSFASNAPVPPLAVALLGSTPGPIDWRRLDDAGRHVKPVGAVSASGVVTWVFSQLRDGSGQLYPVGQGGDVGGPVAIPLAPGTRVVAVGQQASDPFLIVVDKAYELSIIAVRSGQPMPAQDLGIRSTRSASAVVLLAAGKYVIGSDRIGDSVGVALAPFDLGKPGPVGKALAIGPADSQSLRVVATDSGFAAVWEIVDDATPATTLQGGRVIHGLASMLAVYDCE